MNKVILTMNVDGQPVRHQAPLEACIFAVAIVANRGLQVSNVTITGRRAAL